MQNLVFDCKITFLTFLIAYINYMLVGTEADVIAVEFYCPSALLMSYGGQ